MSDDDLRAAATRAEQAYLDALERLDEAEEDGDEREVRRASADVERAKREWHRLERVAEDEHRRRE
jgi:hypothetical protein